MNEYLGKIKSNKKIAKDVYELQIISELKNASSGQFLSVLCQNKTLRRPFSISNFEKINEKESISTILFKLKGDGTSFLSSLKENDEINFLAPLGNGFKIKNEKSLLIGAGIGIAPMLFLKKELNSKNIENILMAGFKEESEIINGADKTVCGGSVVENLQHVIKENNIKTVYACGPSIVLKIVSNVCKELNINSQLALEKVMACGIGVCRGCVIKIKKDNQITRASICKDGPIFNGDEIIWE